MRLLMLFLVIAVAVYVLTGRTRKYARRQRLLFAIATYAVLYLGLVMLTLLLDGIP